MRLMKRNQTAIYYCLYKRKEPLLDEDGNETSEYRVLYLLCRTADWKPTS